jgi:putative ABC transport system substrate-binding protein
MIGRREFITLLGRGAAAWPLAARAQQRRRVGLLIANYAETDRDGQACVAAFLDTFQKLGWSDGRNVRVEYRWAAADAERVQAAAAELVGFAPDVIVVATTPALAELHRLTNTIPIVFIQVGDPVDSGLVASLAHPGGNITGFQSFDAAIGGKWLGLLKETAPTVTRVALLFGSDIPVTVAFLRAAEAVATSLGIAVTAVDVVGRGRIEQSVAAFAGQPDGGLIVTPIATRSRIVDRSSHWRRGTACQQSIRFEFLQPRAASFPTASM